MAAIDRIPSGRWRARWRERPNGPQKSKTFPRKVDAERFLVQVQGDLARGEYVDPAAGRELVREYSTRWASSQPWRPSTRSRVDTLLERHVLPRFGDMPLAAIRPSDVQAWVGQLGTDGLAPATVTGLVHLVGSIMRAAVGDRVIARTPVTGIRLSRADRGHNSLVTLTVAQVHELAQGVDERHRALVLAAAGLGLRQGEACGLTVDRVDFLRRTVRVDRQLLTAGSSTTFGPPKTPASIRTIPLADEVGTVIAAHLQRFGPGQDGLVFTRSGGRPIPRNRLAEVIRRARGETLGAVTFHDLRHFAASGLIAAGCSVKAVQAFLGHATAAETLDTYGHLWPSDDDTIRQAIGKLLEPAESPLSHGAVTGAV
jgi:integrase